MQNYTCFNIDDFFNQNNCIKDIDETDYSILENIINTVKAFERSIYQCVYIIDYYKKGFSFVSSNFYRLCGVQADSIKDMGYDFYINHVPVSDIKMILDINKSASILFNSLSIEEKKLCTVSFDFHILKDGKYQLFNHKFTPLLFTKEGKIWIAICTVSPSSACISGNVIMKNYMSCSYYKYCMRTRKWNNCRDITLSNRELELLHYSTKGFTMKEIAHILKKSTDTVKACRKTIFRKMNVKNITEAITYAQNHQLI